MNLLYSNSHNLYNYAMTISLVYGMETLIKMAKDFLFALCMRAAISVSLGTLTSNFHRHHRFG